VFDRPINYSIYLLAKAIEGLNAVVFKLVRWRDREYDEDFFEDDEPPVQMDQALNPDDTQISLREIDLGDLLIECPECGDRDHLFLLGIGVSQSDDDDNEADTFEVSTVGMVAYTCGCIVFSPCLTDKVGAILNASDNHALTVDMLDKINRCDEHGVLHTEE
jgi:hypothetical protein